MQKTFCSSELTPSQTRAFLDLIKTCQSYEPVRLGFPDDAELFLFTCEQTTVISCLIVCKVQNDLWECYVFTHPNRRKKGLCRDLIGKLCELAPADTELVFLLDHQSPDALTAFSFLEMDLWRTEYQMVKTVKKDGSSSFFPAQTRRPLLQIRSVIAVCSNMDTQDFISTMWKFPRTFADRAWEHG